VAAEDKKAFVFSFQGLVDLMSIARTYRYRPQDLTR
jgi:hypothetical protein